MGPAELALALLLPVAAGSAWLLALRADPRRLVFWGAAFPAGALATALLVFAWMSAGLPLVGGALQATLAVLACCGFALAWERRRKDGGDVADRSSAPRPSWSRRRLAAELWWGALLALALSDVAWIALGHLHDPIVFGDSAGIWTSHAKHLFQRGSFDSGLGRAFAEAGLQHLDYPLLGPLVQVWTMSAAGELLEAPLRWPTHLWHLSLVLLTFAAARRAGPLLGACLAFAYVTLPEMPVVASGTMMDLPVAVAFLGLVDRLLRAAGDDGRREPDFALACLWAAVLVWSKNEGAMLIAAALLAAALGLPWRSLRQNVSPRELSAVALPVAVLALQIGFNTRYGFENDLATGGGQDDRPVHRMLLENLPDKAGAILSFYGSMTADLGRTRGLFALFLAALLLAGRAAWARPTRFLALSVLFGWIGYFAAYVVSFRDLEWHLVTSGRRTAGHLLGAIVLFLALVLRDALVDLRAKRPQPAEARQGMRSRS